MALGGPSIKKLGPANARRSLDLRFAVCDWCGDERGTADLPMMDEGRDDERSLRDLVVARANSSTIYCPLHHPASGLAGLGPLSALLARSYEGMGL